MYELSPCVSWLSRCYFEIFMGADVFAGDSFYLETSRIPGNGVCLSVCIIYPLIFMFS